MNRAARPGIIIICGFDTPIFPGAHSANYIPNGTYRFSATISTGYRLDDEYGAFRAVEILAIK